ETGKIVHSRDVKFIEGSFRHASVLTGMNDLAEIIAGGSIASASETEVETDEDPVPVQARPAPEPESVAGPAAVPLRAVIHQAAVQPAQPAVVEAERPISELRPRLASRQAAAAQRSSSDDDNSSVSSSSLDRMDGASTVKARMQALSQRIAD